MVQAWVSHSSPPPAPEHPQSPASRLHLTGQRGKSSLWSAPPFCHKRILLREQLAAFRATRGHSLPSSAAQDSGRDFTRLPKLQSTHSRASLLSTVQKPLAPQRGQPGTEGIVQLVRATVQTKPRPPGDQASPGGFIDVLAPASCSLCAYSSGWWSPVHLPFLPLQSC